MSTEIFVNDQIVAHVDDDGYITDLTVEGQRMHFVQSPRWDDLRFPAQGLNPAGQAAPPTIDNTTFPGTLLFSGSIINGQGGVAQMPHAWEKGTAVRPHLHWSKTTSVSGGVVWQWRYTKANIGDVFGAYSAWIDAVPAVPHSDTANKQALDAFPELDMTENRESAVICWEFRRNPTVGGDTYGANARLYEFDIHYQVGKLGTVTEIPVGTVV
jgi:hypothetical protein